jgi:long-chain acyl-CoA synthetase
MAIRVAHWRNAIRTENLKPGDRVAILLRNCPEWVIIDQAAMSLGLVTVPLYTRDRAGNAAYILRQAGVRLLFIQNARWWRRLAEAISDELWPPRVVIVDEDACSTERVGPDARTSTAADWLCPCDPEGAEPEVPQIGDVDALATIIYTSGTTGSPKGVMLSHRNILTSVYRLLVAMDVHQGDTLLSNLPLANALERTAGLLLPMLAGAEVAFARSATQICQDLQTVRPTMVIVVPRALERINENIQTQLKGFSNIARRLLFRAAVNVGWARFEHGEGRCPWHPKLLLWPFLQRKVADPTLNCLGGRIRVAASGSAPLPLKTARTFIGLGLPVLQVYGLTEASPVISVNPPHDNRPSSVGTPLPGIQARIGLDEELQVREPSKLLGYWDDVKATARNILPDGWLRTGDQARIEDGYIYITGRLKDILVLSTGEKIAPTPMEMAIAMDPLFEQVLILGEGRSYLTALLVLNADLWPTLAEEYGLRPNHQASFQDPLLRMAMLRRVHRTMANFQVYATIRRIELSLEPWTTANGLLTPTLKVKRDQVLSRFKDSVDAMYC